MKYVAEIICGEIHNGCEFDFDIETHKMRSKQTVGEFFKKSEEMGVGLSEEMKKDFIKNEFKQILMQVTEVLLSPIDPVNNDFTIVVKKK